MPDLYQECKCKTCRAARTTESWEKLRKEGLAQLNSPSPVRPAKDSTLSGLKGMTGGSAVDATPASLDMPKWSCGCAIDAKCAHQVMYTPGHPEGIKVDDAGGIKYDDGKPPMDLLPGEALEAIAQVLAFGAKKYDSWNWAKGFAWSRLFGACLRHLFAWQRGERQDPESGLSHLAHSGACLLFLLTHELKGWGTDDRHKR